MRAQVTLFFIVGLVGFLAIVGALLLLSAYQQRSATAKLASIVFDETKGDVEFLVESCLEQLTKDSVYNQALNSGYLDSRDFISTTAGSFVSFDSFEVPVLSSPSENYFLSEEEMSDRLCKRLLEQMPGCLDFSSLVEQGIGFEVFEQATCQASIKNESVVVQLNYPLRFRKENLEFTVSEFSLNAPWTIGELASQAVYLAGQIRNLHGTLNITKKCREMSELGFDNNVYVYDEGVVQLVDFDPQERDLSGTGLVFQFGFKDQNFLGGCFP